MLKNETITSYEYITSITALRLHNLNVVTAYSITLYNGILLELVTLPQVSFRSYQ